MTMFARARRLLGQLPRDKADTLLLLAAAVLVLAPHALHLPFWVTGACAATLAWRIAITLRGTRMPPSLLLLPLAVAAMGSVYSYYHTLLGRDAGVAMLVLLVTFKMLEMHAKRDLFIVIFLCFFLVLTNFFYAQGIGTALVMVVSIIVLLTAQLSFQFTGMVPPLRRRLWMGARIVGVAAPLALVLFVVFPRIQGPLWGLPGDAHSGTSGISDSMAPGNMSSLAQSDDPAFRVRFSDPVPAQALLYWRGPVLSEFDGRTWTRLRRRGGAGGAPQSYRVGGAPVRYQVTMEASAARWLFALELPDDLPRLDNNTVNVSEELELTTTQPIDQRLRYNATSYPRYALQADDELADAARWLALPAGFNPRALAAGAALRQDSDPLRRAATVLGSFRRDGYAYTLEPPLLGRDGIDEFLYGTRAGFCEHYAGAFVFLMRAAGVPARVVTGYQGGEANPVDGYLTVRQSDAHAWAEIWIARRGWIRIDPTAAVAPERVAHSLARALPRKAPFGMAGLGALMNLNENSWLAQLRFRWGAINNGWNQWVLNYTPERQQGVMTTLGALLTWRMSAGLLAIAALLLLARALRLRRQGDPIERLYAALCQQLARQGHARAPDEGPSAYARRLAALPLPGARKAAIGRFLQLYSAYKYAAPAPHPGLADTLQRLLSDAT
jgi:transglutaminase-like putative cysteine protease